MAPRSVLRTVVLGDLHGSLDAFRTLLTRAELLEGTSWRGGRTILVQLGDVIDRGPDSVQTYDFLGEIQVRASKGKGRVVRLLGNHEIALLEGFYDLTNFPEPETLGERIRRDVLEGRVQAAYAHAGWFFTHAGVHHNLLQRLRAEMNAGQEKRVRFTPPRLASLLNQKLRRAVETNDYTDSIFSVGHSRGGTNETGGIFWADFDDELEAPRRAPRLHQVFGHTPEGYEGARFRRTSDGRRINIDIGIAEEYGGNLGYLEIREREAIAHYFEEEGEVVESMGVAPLSRRRASAPKPEKAEAP
jgi:hypothetical protein